MARTGQRAACAALALAAGSCAGAGEGSVSGTINVPVCQLSGAYDLNASFFGANRYGNSLQIRIQNGGGPPDYTDNLILTIDDTTRVTAAIATSPMLDAQGNRIATLPVGPDATGGIVVHATLSPNHSCGRLKVTRFGQTVGLPAVSGSITFRSIDQGPDPDPDTAAAFPDPRLTDVTAFHFVMNDPRPIGSPAPEDLDPHSPIGSAELSGSFRFEYSRRVPAVLFP
jgi:hypothetical protein